MIEPLVYLFSSWFAGLNLLVWLGMATIVAMLFVPKVGVFALKLAGQAGVGSLAIVGLNWALASLGFGTLFVGLNLITVGVSGLLGLPGVLSLYILSAII